MKEAPDTGMVFCASSLQHVARLIARIYILEQHQLLPFFSLRLELATAYPWG
jgi:hypothetical protein